MITRYSRPDMVAVWESQNKFQKWLDIELAACYAHAKMGTFSMEIYEDIKAKAKFDVQRIDEIEAEIQHDVIAFLTSVAEFVGPNSRYVHLGLTSSDVVDTAFALLIHDAGVLLLKALDDFQAVLKAQAYAYKNVPMMGRTHGVHAEPLTFGLKLTVWFEEMKRNRERLVDALESMRVGKLSGAVGNYAHMSPDIEAYVCETLGLNVSLASTQILQRDRHAHVMTTLAIIAGSLEKFATEIRALQKTEMNEVIEPFSSKQKGSSAMPHKRNPIMCERVTGLARVIRGYAVTSMENQNLWHERDISHSSTERIIFPDATVTLDYMFSVMTKVIKNMEVHPEQMMENIGRSYHVFYSQQLLLKLVDKGMSREDAYRVVQSNALDAFKHKVLFDHQIQKDERITTLLSPEEIQSIFSLDKYQVHQDMIYTRVYG